MGKRTVFFGALLLAAVAGCALTGRSLPTAEQLAGAEASNAEVLRKGRISYVRECGACHRVYWPEEYAPGAWERLGPEMAKRAGLGTVESRDLTHFLVTASRYARESR